MKKSMLAIVLLVTGVTFATAQKKESTKLQKAQKTEAAKTAEVAELYKQQGKYVEVNGVGAIDEISEKLFAEVEKIK